MNVLNLGAGNKPMASDNARHVVNHDRTAHRLEINAVHDLNVLPWPWPDNSFDQIIARAVFEHLDIDLVRSLNECWRLLRPDGVLHLKLPYWNSDNSYQDPTHRWFFSLRALDQFDPDTERGKEYGFYTPYKWQIVKGARLNDAKTSIYATLRVRK